MAAAGTEVGMAVAFGADRGMPATGMQITVRVEVPEISEQAHQTEWRTLQALREECHLPVEEQVRQQPIEAD
jgi:hypothetical protein